jgi:hypothetical protein
MDEGVRTARVVFRARLAAVLILLGLAAVSCGTSQAAVPSAANAYRDTFEREIRRVFGVDAPFAAFAAQIHAESLWNCRATSHVGAMGCAQFMPGTARWIGEVAPDLAGGDPYSPAWAFRAHAVYMGRLYARTRSLNPVESAFPPMTECDRLAFAMRDYNGGAGNTLKDRRAAARIGINPDAWRAVGIVNGAGRGPGFFKENTRYPVRILVEIVGQYVLAGWGRTCRAEPVAVRLDDRNANARPILYLRRTFWA